jgi:hypothetical protein
MLIMHLPVRLCDGSKYIDCYSHPASLVSALSMQILVRWPHFSYQEELSRIRPEGAHSGTTQSPQSGLLMVSLANFLFIKGDIQ